MRPQLLARSLFTPLQQRIAGFWIDEAIKLPAIDHDPANDPFAFQVASRNIAMDRSRRAAQELGHIADRQISAQIDHAHAAIISGIGWIASPNFPEMDTRRG